MNTNELLRIKQVSLHATGQPASKVRVHFTNPTILCVVLPNPLTKKSLPITIETTSTISILHRLEGPHMVLPTTMSSKTPLMTTERNVSRILKPHQSADLRYGATLALILEKTPTTNERTQR
jgi:hypothetical protein